MRRIYREAEALAEPDNTPWWVWVLVTIGTIILPMFGTIIPL